MTGQAFLLSPSRGLGGGIERFTATIEAALSEAAVPYYRFDLRTSWGGLGPRAKLGFALRVCNALADQSGPVRLLLTHPHLLPVVRLARGYRRYAGATVLFHGSEIWSRRLRHTRLLRRADVRVVAGSSFSAGALAGTCRAKVLNPGVGDSWYRMLVAAAGKESPAPDQIRLLTTFRLSQWRDKGLPILLEAISLLRDSRIYLTVCGSGPVPAALLAAVRAYPFCRVTPDLPDAQLAEAFASADLFVLATRTRPGASGCGEGFGLVLLEAQLAGTPVVAPAYGGSGDAYVEGITGQSPVDESPEALAAVLDELVANEVRRKELAHAAGVWARARFEPARYGDRLVRTMLNAEPAGPLHPRKLSPGGAGE